MDLIYTDIRRQDVGVMRDYTFDLAFGVDENNFELTVDKTNHCCEPNCLVYVENTDYGGIIDGLRVSTDTDNIVYTGRTWHGIFESKIIEPDAGEAYLKVSGEANTIIGEMIKRLGLSNLFTVSNEDSGLTIDSYAFERYTNAYLGLTKMLEYVSAKLTILPVNGKVVVSAMPIVDYSQTEQLDNDSVAMQVEKITNSVNHLICLGKGELEDRQAIHLYADKDGNVSGTQTFFGIEEVMLVYDCPNIESVEELTNEGTKKLEEYATGSKVELNLTDEEASYDIGDIIGTKEVITGIVANEKITKKIVTINKGVVNIQYKVGE